MKIIRLSFSLQSLILLFFAMVATFVFEHSQLDITISQLFYDNGHWLLKKNTQPYAFIFYDFPKHMLIALGLVLIGILVCRYGGYDVGQWQSSPFKQRQKRVVKTQRWRQSLSNRDIVFLLLALVGVPSVIAVLKSVTHVSCPNHLLLFHGQFAYVSIWQNILAKTPAKCFPAAHASAGFALYAVAYLPQLRAYKKTIVLGVSGLGWSMGVYKMCIGDHFFSHTLVSMLLSWSMVCGIAAMIHSVKSPRRLQEKANRTIHARYFDR